MIEKIIDKRDYWKREIFEEEYVFQSLFFHWCQTYYLMLRQLLIRFKYYHLVDWWRRFDQWDVTVAPRGKVELWLCNEVQGLVKTVMTRCIDNLLEVTKVGYT